MADRKPFAYENLKILLQYMDPNKRVEAALKIPSIRTAHKNVPLRVKKLTLKNLSTEMDNTEYKLGVYQQYFNQSDTPFSVKRDNEDGGYEGEIDSFGLKSSSDRTVSTLGDLDFRRLETLPVEEEGDDDLRETQLRNRLALWARIDETSDSNRRLVDSMKVELQMLQFKRNGIPLPYKQYFQLSIKKQGRVYIERVESSGKQLRDAMKYINTVLFGGKNQVVFVNDLTFPIERQIYYLPENFKVKVRNLGLVMRDLQNVKESGAIVESSFPLAKLSIRIEHDLNVEELDDDIIKSADALNVLHYPVVSPYMMLPKLENKRIHIQSVWPPQLFDYVFLIQDWVISGKPVGPVLSFGVLKQADAEHFLRILGQHLEVVDRSRRSVTIPMQHGQNVFKIFFKPAEPTNQALACMYQGFVADWIVKIEVLEAREQVAAGFFARGLEMLGALRCPFGR